MKGSPQLVIVAVLGLGLGCADTPTAPAASEAAEVLLARGGNPGKPGGGGDGGDEGDDGSPPPRVTVSLGMAAGPGDAVVEKDNNRELLVRSDGTLTLAMGTDAPSGTYAQALAAAAEADGSNDVCTFTPADMTTTQKQRLADGLLATHEGFQFRIDKREQTGRIVNAEASGGDWTSLGFNTGQGHVPVSYEGTNPNDATGTRRFRFATGAPGEGAIRIVTRLGDGNPSDPIGDLVCFHQEEVLVVLEP